MESKEKTYEKFNTALAQIAVKNHAHATKNEYAQFQRKITVDNVLNSRKAARKSLGLYDFAPISDGATALIVTSEDIAKKITDNPIYVLGAASATDYLNFPARADLTHFTATKIATDNAVKKANINRQDIQILELYDQSTVTEMVSLEDMGFCPEGNSMEKHLPKLPRIQRILRSERQKTLHQPKRWLKSRRQPPWSHRRRSNI